MIILRVIIIIVRRMAILKVLCCFQIPDEVVSAAEALLQSDNPKVKDSIVTKDAVSSACENVLAKGKTNHELYTKLVTSLVEHLESGAL